MKEQGTAKPGFDFWQFHFCMFFFSVNRLLRLEQSCLRICGTKPSFFSISVPAPLQGGAVGTRGAVFSFPPCTPLLSKRVLWDRLFYPLFAPVVAKRVSWDRAALIDTGIVAELHCNPPPLARDRWQADSASNTRDAAAQTGAHRNGLASAAASSWVFSGYFLSACHQRHLAGQGGFA